MQPHNAAHPDMHTQYIQIDTVHVHNTTCMPTLPKKHPCHIHVRAHIGEHNGPNAQKAPSPRQPPQLSDAIASHPLQENKQLLTAPWPVKLWSTGFPDLVLTSLYRDMSDWWCRCHDWATLEWHSGDAWSRAWQQSHQQRGASCVLVDSRSGNPTRSL